ncbi:hypothetical protein BpHYR1_040467 [Brachionus plicatilis]|uniref:Uncharacterized protein n=1 Tax=Brachionus plicatilis TaxID=10195 RepID=A0A3M7REX7_BRAPC|nr:hypothetical protein BpHYR1_040467 [Brachionus plicatilis]
MTDSEESLTSILLPVFQRPGEDTDEEAEEVIDLITNRGKCKDYIMLKTYESYKEALQVVQDTETRSIA